MLIACETGPVTAYALDALYDRGSFFIRPGDQVYEGQVVGEHCRAGDLVVNVVKAKNSPTSGAPRQGRRGPGPAGAGHVARGVPGVHRGR